MLGEDNNYMRHQHSFTDSSGIRYLFRVRRSYNGELYYIDLSIYRNSREYWDVCIDSDINSFAWDACEASDEFKNFLKKFIKNMAFA